jgi:hypothetical protein
VLSVPLAVGCVLDAESFSVTLSIGGVRLSLAYAADAEAI